jgi:hypothetical protein
VLSSNNFAALVKNVFFILFFFYGACAEAQVDGDSIRQSDSNPVQRKPAPVRRVPVRVQRDTTAVIRDSLAIMTPKDTISRDSLQRASISQVKDSAYKADFQLFRKKMDSSIYNHNPFFSFKNPVLMISAERKRDGKEGFFYSITALLLFFALLKNAFSRYLDDLFRVFFRTTLKQRQTREQLMTAPLPSLLFNVLYVISAALFITLLLRHFHLGDQFNFWILLSYCVAGLIIVYAIKFIALKFFGWILGITEATNTYIFIVFTTNKIIGVVLLPFIVGLAFMDNTFYEVLFTLSVSILAMLFIYRFYLSFVSVQKQITINFFHFLLYIAAFEIIPLLLINKLLVSFFSESY